MPNVVDSSVPFIYDSPVRSGYFQGYISNFRVTTGQALYTGNFTPPTASLTTSSVGAIGQTFEAQRTNLFTYSADFNNASWLKTRSGVTPNTVIAPDGTLTGDYFYANGTGVPYLYKQITLTQYQPYTMSCFVKQGDLPTPRVRLRDFTEVGSVVFDIVSGTISTGASGICSNPSIVDAGNGWFRISAVFTPTIATGNHNISPVHIDDVAGSIFGFYCWGAQLDIGTKPTSYIATTITPVAVGPVDAPATNLLSYSEEFNFINNIPWEKSQVTVRSNVAIAPNGTLTADKLVENTANLEHILFMRRSGRNETATLSVYAKSSERYIRLGFSNFINWASGATFNLFNGTVVAGSIDPNGSNPDYANPIPSIVSVGDGWYRCSFTVTKGSLQNTSYPYFDPINPSTPTNSIYAGDGSSGVFIWGAQLEIGSIATNYIPTFGAPATRSAGGVAAQINASSVAVLAFVDNSNVTTNLGSIPGVQFVSNTVTNPMIDSIRTGLDYNQPIVEPWQTSQIKVEYLDKIAVGDTIRITNTTTGANVTTNVTAVNKDTITFTTIPGFTFTYANNYTVQNLSTTVWPAAQVTTTDWRNASTPRERLATQSVLGNKTLLKYPIITVGGVNVVGSSGNLSLYDRGDLQGDSKFRVRSIISNTTFIGNTINFYLDDSDILTPVASNLTANTSVLLLENIGSATSLYRDGNLRVTDNTTGVKTNVQIISSYFNSITIDAYFDSSSNLSIESRNVFAWPKLTQQPSTRPSSPREYLWFVENFPSYIRSRLDYPVLVDPRIAESRIPKFKVLDKKTLHEPKIDLTTPTSLSFYNDFAENYQSTTITGISTVKYNVSNFYLNDEDVLTKTIADSATKILYIQPGTFNRWLLNSQVKIRDEVSGNVALYTVQEVQPNYIVINTTDTFASNILTLSRPVRETTSAFFANGVPRITPQFGVTSVTPLVNLYYATYFPTIRNRTYSYLGPKETDLVQRTLNKTDLMDNNLDPLGPKGDAVYKIPGTYIWRAPKGVTSVSVVAVGGGGGGSNYGDGGGGGGLGWGNVSVVPGQVYTIKVGSGGAGGERSTKESKGSTGGDSWFGSNNTIAGFGGTGGGLTLDNLGGGFVGEGGGWGGAGGKWTGLGYRAGAGGGGAGGFTANGGRGGYSHTLSSIPTILATTSTGGGGGGGTGAYNSPFILDYAGSAGGGGGGVGIYGNVGPRISTIINEGLDPSATLQYWNPSLTFSMTQFGGLGAGTAHGYLPSTSFYLNIPNLTTHNKIRYQFYWHFVDSVDNESSYLEIDGVRYLQFTKTANAPGASSITINRCEIFTWVSNNTYSYSPWGNNTSSNGYFIIDTGWINHTKGSISINHFFGPDQAQTDEACYVSHSTFQIWNEALEVVAGSILEPLTDIVRYESMNYVVTGGITLTATSQTTEYSMFKTSAGGAWNSSVHSTTPFTAPCTIEFFKNAVSGDNGLSYAMIGWNPDPLTNSSYDTLDYCAYPYRTDAYSVHHNGTEVQLSGTWDPSVKFYIVYDTDGYIKHYNGSKLLYSTVFTSRLVYFDSSFYAQNSTFGGFSNVRVIKRAWDGSSYKGLSTTAYARTIYDAPGYYVWTVPQGINKINVYLWGGGGAGGRPGGWSFGSPGGAGGAANATLDVVPGTSYYITVGSGGNFVGGDLRAIDIGGGGSACFNTSDNSYGGGGGGYSGIFLTSTRTQANAVIIAGGGGGGGSSRAGTGNQGGAGGGSVGQDGASPYDNKPLYRGRGGTQTEAGVDASSDGANTVGNQGALQGGNSRTNSYGGGGGGGYWGGSGGGYSETNTMAGGGGGSGYFNGSLIAIGNLVSGEFNLPGDYANPLRGNIAGNAGSPSNVGFSGRVVIDLVLTGGQPGWGGQYGTSVPMYTADYKPVDGVSGGLYGGGGSGGSNPTSGILGNAGYAVAGGAGADGAVRIIYGTDVFYPSRSRTEFTTGNTLIAQSNHQVISSRLSASSRDLLLLSVLAPGYRGRSITPFGKQLSDDRVIYRTISKGVGNFTSQIKLAAPILRESVNILKTRGFIKTIIGIKGIRDLLRLGNLRTPRLPYNEATTSLYLTESGRIELFALNRDSAKLFDIAERKKEPLSFWS